MRSAIFRIKEGRVRGAVFALRQTNTDGEYQAYRRLEDYLNIFAGEGFCLAEIAVPSVDVSSFGALYVFERNESSGSRQ